MPATLLGTALLTSSLAAEGAQTGHRVGIMKRGRLVNTLSTADLSHVDLERIYLEHMRD